MELNLFDLGVFIIVGLSALLSFYRGLVREVLSLGGWIVASIVTLRFIEPATQAIQPQIGSQVIASAVASIGLFFITLVVLSIASGLLLKVLKPADRVGRLDNLGGLAFGVARGALIVSIGFFTMDLVTNGKYPQVVSQAVSRPYVAACAHWLKTIAPDYLDQVTAGKGLPGEEGTEDDVTSKRKINTLIRGLDSKRGIAVKRIDQTTGEAKEQTEDLPSMEDLQRRIREENERQ